MKTLALYRIEFPKAFSALWNWLIAVLVALDTAINRPFLAKLVAGLRFELPLATRFSTLKMSAGALSTISCHQVLSVLRMPLMLDFERLPPGF